MRWGNVSEGRSMALEKGVRASKGSGASEWPAGREGELSPIAGLGFLSPPQASPRGVWWVPAAPGSLAQPRRLPDSGK